MSKKWELKCCECKARKECPAYKAGEGQGCEEV